MNRLFARFLPATSGTPGKISHSRLFMWAGFVLFGGFWFFVMLGIAVDRAGLIPTGFTWEDFDGGLTWGVGFFFITVLPNIGNSIGEGVGNRPAPQVSVAKAEKVEAPAADSTPGSKVG